ncbi:very short patch repair endonuclease [Mycobacterium sp. 1165196.3]|uniref:very short patch repair endonuclease n=1 Tax=unclassified Mycobacterium TaxID=2642494 RepID=UPI00080218DB|nr:MULTISPECIES: very short patch repair endonuclease [unclassified Mycobacterium]OBK39015.1 very short patch repair endonuclease [Mycobacterium sp. 1165196.3]OBK98779.1 very short patch repair endonuclease [Mycobacterium sp. 1245499.0]
MSGTPLTDPRTSLRMSRQRRRDTDAEMVLRRELHARGLRYRVHRPLPGMSRRRADIVFPLQRVVVFVDGCFWHGCPDHKTMPKKNGVWWEAKLRGNIARDRETDTYLRELGWTVVRIWEHESLECAADRVETAVRSARSRS